MTDGPESPGTEARRREILLARVRWGGIAFGAWQVVSFRSLLGEHVPGYVRPSSFAVLAALAAVNVYVWSRLKRRAGADLRQVGLLAFLADATALFAITWLWSFLEFGTTWVILYLVPLEGAARYALRGAMAPVLAAVVLEPLRDAYRLTVFDFPFSLSDTTFRVGVMALIAIFAGTTARSLRRQREEAESRAESLRELSVILQEKMDALRKTEQESARRAATLATVAASARSMSALDTEQVLASVVLAASRLGFEAADICLFDDAEEIYRVVQSTGLPAEYTEQSHRVTDGVMAEVRRQRGTVIVPDYSAYEPGVPELRELGYRGVISTPVWSQGRIAAALTAGTRETRTVTDEDVEALELLAAQTGRALENAERFEEEHRMVERLEELNRMKQEFIDMVSHELRTPLTAINGMGLTLAEKWDSMGDEMRQDLIGRLNANAETLQGIITTLLDFSRLEEGRARVETATVPVGQLVEGVASRLRNLFDDKDHRLTIVVEPDLATVADPVLLERVIENLLSNAAKHTPDGTPVQITAIAEGASVRIDVVDEGPGIPPHELGQLGERFFRGGDPNSRKTRGAGLGLALIVRVLRLHGSELQIESELGKGSRFWFHLPLARRRAIAAS